MKRTRDGFTVVTPYDLRRRVMQQLQQLVSPLFMESLQHHDTESLMTLLAQIQAISTEEGTNAAGSE